MNNENEITHEIASMASEDNTSAPSTENSDFTEKKEITTQAQHDERVIASYRRVYMGTVPPSEEMENFDRIYPGAAAWFFKSADEEQAHRHSKEMKILASTVSSDRHGQYLGTALLMVLIMGVVACAYFDKQSAACALVGLGVTGVILSIRKPTWFGASSKKILKKDSVNSETDTNEKK